MMEMTLRQRKGGVSEVLHGFKKFDFYQKVHEDYQIKTGTGGLLSIVATFVMVALFYGELLAYMTVEVQDHIVVDKRYFEKLHVQMNISFPHLRCDEVSVDNVDSIGDHQVNIHSSGMHKLPIDHRGFLTPDAWKLSAIPKEDCQSCYDGIGFEHSCCNTCGELKAAYQDAKIPMEKAMDKPQCTQAPGCQVFGDALVNKVSGNLHVALGRSRVENGKHIHEFNLQDASLDGFNTTHTIHRLRFGADVPGVESMLEGTEKIVKQDSGMFHYYIKLIPTLFSDDKNSDPVYTHQYSVTTSAKRIEMDGNKKMGGLPGVFFVYEFSPFMVNKVTKSVPLSHFLVSVSAIIGGVFTVLQLLDRLVHGVKRVVKTE